MEASIVPALMLINMVSPTGARHLERCPVSPSSRWPSAAQLSQPRGGEGLR